MSQRTPLATASNMRVAPGRNLKGAAASRQPAVTVAPPNGETATFLNFVRLLSSKPEDEQRMLMQVARQEASGAAPRRGGPQASIVGGLRRSGSAQSIRNNPLRRSASLDGSDFGGRANGTMQGVAVGPSSPSDAYGMTIGLDGRPRSADATAGGGTTADPSTAAAYSNGWGRPMTGSTSSVRSGTPALRQRQAQARAAAAAAQLQQQFSRRAAACTLQAHWRGWQHRRLARYLRARRKRALRLDWLWHLEYVTNLLHWHEAAHTVQAHWRGRRGPMASAKRGAAPPAGPVTTRTRAEKVSDGPKAPAPPPVAPGGGEGERGAASGGDAPPNATGGAAAANTRAVDAAENGGAEGGAEPTERRAGFSGTQGRLTVHWKGELSEVRQYAVAPPLPPRW